ncbi:MAG: ABC transporter substrate-binding protein [Puniceicoccaceae bacterium]|nr:MAG: ABC transporter substrate-binding protein [Puniceicoccaceae bacterium]
MHIHFYSVLLASCLILVGTTHAVDAQLEKLQATIDGALDVIYSAENADKSVEEKETQVREVIESSYDLNVIIRRAIGRNWRLMNEVEQTEVLELVKQLVVRSYVKGMDGKSRPEISLGRVTELSDKRIEIDSSIRLDGKTYNLVYRLGRMPSGWQIYDIVAENISVVSNFRQQLDDHFRNSDATKLIERLNELLEKNAPYEELQI